MSVVGDCRMAAVLVRRGPRSGATFNYSPYSIRSVVTAQAPVDEADQEWVSAKPYGTIPGPKPLPIPKFGNFWRFLPFGTYGKVESKDLGQVLHKQFGPIAKLGGMGKYDMVLINDPEDAQKVFRTEGIWPIRRGVETIDYYRRHTRPQIFGDFIGVATTQGEEWGKNRSAVNQPMMKPQNVKNYHEPIQLIAAEFLERIKTLRDDNQEMPSDFHNELNKWALESISYVALDARLGCLDPNLSSDSDAQIMIDSVQELFDLMYKMDILPSLWRLYSTRNWRKLVKFMDNITGISSKHIQMKLKTIEQRKEGDKDGQSILEILLNGVGGQSAAITMAIDMMTAGIDTTSNTTAITWHFLSKNQEAQDKLYDELCQLMPNKTDKLPKDYMSKANYLKACFKESQRLLPIAPGNQREAGKDLVIKGYQIPKGTQILMSHVDMCLNEKYFVQPNQYIPDRWLKETEGGPMSAKNAHPFVFLPFGFGPRMCIGRRLAELEMHTLTAQVFRNFKVSFNYDEFKTVSSIVTRPGSPLKFKMEERTN